MRSSTHYRFALYLLHMRSSMYYIYCILNKQTNRFARQENGVSDPVRRSWYCMLYTQTVIACMRAIYKQLLYALQVDGIQMIDTLALVGWRKSNGKPMSNIDLWKLIHEWIGKCEDVRVEHVRAHARIPGNSLSQRLELRTAIKRHADLITA